jgi:hypothetical protein
MAPSGSNSPAPTPPATQTRGGRKTTASKALLSTSKTIEDHIAGTGIRTDTTNITTARKILTTHGLTIPAAGSTIKEISLAIFEFSISANLGALQTDILRAFAILLHEVEQAMDTTTLINRIEGLIAGPISTLEERVESLSEITESHKAALDSAIKEMRGNLSDSTTGIDNAVINALNALKQQTQMETQDRRSNGPRSYAEAAKRDIPAPLTKILSRSEGQSRQILLDKRSLSSTDTLKDLTEAQLVTKATMAIDLLRKDEITIPQDLTFLSARRLPHGGILYELDSTASVQWFNTPINRSNFLNRFGTDILIKDRSFQVLVEYVPLSFAPEDKATLTDIEKKAGITPSSIIKARYVKPIQRRLPTQRTAHIILTLNSKTSANQIIKHGLSIAGKKVYGRKLTPEPTRCLKCQSFEGAHVAVNCPKEVDTCGTCGATHRTAECTVTERELYFCSNCNTHGHGAWDRECPTFKQKQNAYASRNEESKYRFFPTEDPLTWETTVEQEQEHSSTHPWHSHQPPQFKHSSQPSSRPLASIPHLSNEEGFAPRENAHRRAPQKERNPNLVPLGRQARVDQWFTPSQTPRTQPSPANTGSEHWAQYNTEDIDVNNPSGWD